MSSAYLSSSFDLGTTCDRVAVLVNDNKKLKGTLKEISKFMEVQYKDVAEYRAKVAAARSYQNDKVQEAKDVVTKLQNVVLVKNGQSPHPLMESEPHRENIPNVDDFANMRINESKNRDEHRGITQNRALKNGNRPSTSSNPLTSPENALNFEVSQDIAELPALRACRNKMRAEANVLNDHVRTLVSDASPASASANVRRQKAEPPPSSGPDSCAKRVDVVDYLTGCWPDIDNSKGDGAQTNSAMQCLNMSSCDATIAGHVKDSLSTINRIESGVNQPDETTQGDIMTLRSQVLTLINDVKEMQKTHVFDEKMIAEKTARIKQMESEFMKYNNDDDKHNQEMLVISLHRMINENDRELRMERERFLSKCDEYVALQQFFTDLVSDYKSLMSEFERFKTSQKKESGEHTKTLGAITAKLVTSEEVIQYSNERLQKVQMDFRNEKEKTSLLKIQAEAYKDDFGSERQSRQKLNEEKEVILQQLHELQIRHQQLLDEYEQFSRKQLKEMQHRHRHASDHAAAPPPPVTWLPRANQAQPGSADRRSGLSMDQLYSEAVYKRHYPKMDETSAKWACPKCSLECPDMDSLQVHVCDCLDGHDA